MSSGSNTNAPVGQTRMQRQTPSSSSTDPVPTIVRIEPPIEPVDVESDPYFRFFRSMFAHVPSDTLYAAWRVALVAGTMDSWGCNSCNCNL